MEKTGQEKRGRLQKQIGNVLNGKAKIKTRCNVMKNVTRIPYEIISKKICVTFVDKFKLHDLKAKTMVSLGKHMAQYKQL